MPMLLEELCKKRTNMFFQYHAKSCSRTHYSQHGSRTLDRLLRPPWQPNCDPQLQRGHSEDPTASAEELIEQLVDVLPGFSRRLLQQQFQNSNKLDVKLVSLLYLQSDKTCGSKPVHMKEAHLVGKGSRRILVDSPVRLVLTVKLTRSNPQSFCLHRLQHELAASKSDLFPTNAINVSWYVAF